VREGKSKKEHGEIGYEVCMVKVNEIIVLGNIV
jgi:hypothetical protein